jgi:transposase
VGRTTNEEETEMDAKTVAVDLAKDIFEVAVSHRAGRIVDRKRLARRPFEQFLETLPAGTTVVMEACGTAHYWGRRCQARGLVVRLLPVQYVRPYVRGNKTDRTDTAGLLEAHRCADMHPVPVKTPEQQAVQALHRVRSQWQTTRTARINAMRALLREQGVVIATGARTVMTRIPALLSDVTGAIPETVRRLVAALWDEVRGLEQRIADIDRELERMVREDPIAQRLYAIPGIGVLTATALVGSVGHIHAFRRGRQFASWLGLTPREASSGHRRYLSRISKRGDPYLRCLLTHGARAIVASARRTAADRRTGVQQWALSLAARRGYNKAVIAVANKLARRIWAVWHYERDYQDPRPLAA